MRDNFSKRILRALATRVALQCSNPECRAFTSGPQTNPEMTINVGVAAHITAAAPRGPRFDANLSVDERRSLANGLWLCQTCAKLIDSDTSKFHAGLLRTWKFNAEREALTRLGKTNRPRSGTSTANAEKELKRDHRLRDELTKAMLKTSAERMAQRMGQPQYAKFAMSEFIVHRLDADTYPNYDDSPGISSWFKLEAFDFYFNGVEGILSICYALVSSLTKSWSELPESRCDENFPDGFGPVKIFKTGKIPWRNIRHYDLNGDEYYRDPHFYCLFADNGAPYEGFGYYVIPEDHSYHYPLPAEGRVSLDRLLSLKPEAQQPWEFLP